MHSSLAGSSYKRGPEPGEPLLPATGPWALGRLDSELTGPRPRTLEGDSGGPLFLSGDASQRVLVGIWKGNDNRPSVNNGVVYDYFVGLWTIRDWIRQNTPDAPFDTNCALELPNSAGAKSASVAQGPDGAIYVAAVLPDNTIGYWGVSLVGQFLGTVPGASSNLGDPPGLGIEPTAASGQPLKLGLAYRDRTTGKLKYSRWSASGGW